MNARVKSRTENPGSSRSGATAADRRSRIKLWCFRVAAFLLIPLILLVLIEAALRVGGFGRTTSYFIGEEIGGHEVLVPNEAFSRMFFPAKTARSPNPVVITRKKAPGTTRIFVFGGSAALGDPRPGYGFPRYLEVLLRERFPDRKFEVICTAMTAINSHVILPIARECAALDGDLWIIYMGNNEMVGPFGATGVFKSQTPPLAWVRAYVALSNLKTFQLLQTIAGSTFAKGDRQTGWTGMRMFLDRKVAPDDPRREIVNHHFERNLEDMLKAAGSHDVPVILSTVSSNTRDLGPFASAHGSKQTEASIAEFDRLLAEGVGRQRNGDYQDAIPRLEQASQADPLFAEASYRMARARLALGQTDAARPHFTDAVDNDALPFRTGSRINGIIRHLAGENEGRVILADTEADMASLTEYGIAGNEFFLDHVHFNNLGNYSLAKIFAERAVTTLGDDFGRALPEWPTLGECNDQLAITEWNRAAMLRDMLGRIAEPPFSGQLDQPGLVRHLQAELTKALEQSGPENVFPARGIYEDAIAAHPDDYRLRENFAEFLESIGDPEEAIRQWSGIHDLLPEHFGPYYHMGRLQGVVGRADEAHTNLTQALALRPDAAVIQIELGNNLIRRGDLQAALDIYETVERTSPERTEVLMRIADVLARLGRKDEAIAKLEEAAKARPHDWEVRYLLGIERARAGRLPEARTEFEAAVRLNPDNARARLNLGVALAKLGYVQNAAEEFREALRIDPLNESAAQQLKVAEKMLESAAEQSGPESGE